MRALLAHVSASLLARDLLPADRRLLVAVSGGADSMILLHTLHRLARRLSLQLTVAHGHHQLRGRAADADAALVEATAQALDWPSVSERLPVAEENALSGESLEMTARRLRHSFLARVARKHGISTVAIAHHADDQAELVLLRLLRGSGGDGLGGMAWDNPSPADSRIRLIRPLLDLPKTRLVAAAGDAGIPFREDRSNRDPRFLRNRIRNELLPRLERRFSPSIRELLVRTAELVGTDAAFVTQEARRWLAATSHSTFGSLHVAIQRAVLREQVRALGHEPGFALLERLRLSGESGEIAPGRCLYRADDGRIHAMSPASRKVFRTGELSLSLRPSGASHDFNGTRVVYRLRSVRASTRLRYDAGTEFFSAPAVGSEVTLRHWRPGDRFQPLGFPRPAKLQDLFTNRKVPAERRRGLLVATTDTGTLFWVESLPPGELFKVTPTTRRILVWKWRSQGELRRETPLAPSSDTDSLVTS